MLDSFSTPRNKIRTLILFLVCGLLTIASVIVGIDDNPPGVLLALLAAIAFVLAFSHSWRTARKFLLLLTASLVGFVLFIIVNIMTDSLAQNPATLGVIQNLMQNPAYEALNLIFTMICAAAFFVGAVGSIAMFIRSRRQVT